MAEECYLQFARHLASVGMPLRDELVEILRQNFSPAEVEIALLLPTEGSPLQPAKVEDIAARGGLPAAEVAETLEALAARGLIFSRRDPDGTVAYALHRIGFGFPQTFFWKGEETDHARNMNRLVLKYFDRKTTAEAFGGEGTKPYRYIPVGRSLKPDAQAVYPHHRMESVLEGAATFAVAHCPCRVQAKIVGRACSHPVEVCLKFDDMAQYLIDRGLGREITREEAREIVRQSAEAGLVHFVDNAAGKVKHNCNCCGCSCWNVGSIRRRKIPRDALMAVYFLRETDAERCTGCGECVEICPVAAITMDSGVARVDPEWCIGCGLCATRCAFDAVRIVERPDREGMPSDFGELHSQILREREAG